MVWGILVIVPSLLAGWVCYWFGSVFPLLSGRVSRIVCLVCPVLFSVGFALVVGEVLGASGTEIQFSDRPEKGLAALLLAITLVLVLLTLPIALLAGRIQSRAGGTRHP